MQSKSKNRQGGFTLIELVVVIVILGILAAFAIPRFANIARDARISAINGLAGSLRSTSALVHGMALARNTTVSVDLEGNIIELVNSYPKATLTGLPAGGGIGDALNNLDTSQFSATPGVGTIVFAALGAATPANCSVTYAEPVAAGSPAVITTDVTAC